MEIYDFLEGSSFSLDMEQPVDIDVTHANDKGSFIMTFNANIDIMPLF